MLQSQAKGRPPSSLRNLAAFNGASTQVISHHYQAVCQMRSSSLLLSACSFFLLPSIHLMSCLLSCIPKFLSLPFIATRIHFEIHLSVWPSFSYLMCISFFVSCTHQRAMQTSKGKPHCKYKNTQCVHQTCSYFFCRSRNGIRMFSKMDFIAKVHTSKQSVPA